MIGQDVVEPLHGADDPARADLDVRRGAGEACAPLVDHHLGVGQREPLALGAAGQQHRRHAGAQPHAVGGHIGLDRLHGVVDRQAGGHIAAGAHDVHADIPVGILALQVEELGRDQAGHLGLHRRGDEDDALLEQPREDIVRALTAIGGLHDHRHEAHRQLSCSFCGSEDRSSVPAAVPARSGVSAWGASPCASAAAIAGCACSGSPACSWS